MVEVILKIGIEVHQLQMVMVSEDLAKTRTFQPMKKTNVAHQETIDVSVSVVDPNEKEDGRDVSIEVIGIMTDMVTALITTEVESMGEAVVMVEVAQAMTTEENEKGGVIVVV